MKISLNTERFIARSGASLFHYEKRFSEIDLEKLGKKASGACKLGIQ